MPSIQKCCQCLHYFTMVKLPRKLPTCPHSICETCLREIIDTKQEVLICGFCSNLLKRAEIRIFSLNTALLLTLSEAPPPRQPPPKEEENQLLVDLSPSPSSPPEECSVQQLCPLHKVTMDIICISDKQKICPHCALFGKHRDHRIKRLDDFQKEISEKRNIFSEIHGEKETLMRNDGFKIYQQLKKTVQLKKAQILNDIDQQYKTYADLLLKAKERAFENAKAICIEIEHNFHTFAPVIKFQKSRCKFQKWEKTCLQAMQQIDKSPKVEDKLCFYYEGPLEIVTEGFIFIEELTKYSQQATKKLNDKITEVQLNKEMQETFNFDRLFNIKKGGGHTPHSSVLKSVEEESELNPFLDCTSSEITIGQSTLLNNTSLEAEISSISKHIKGEPSRISLPRKQPQLKSVKSVDRSRISIQCQKTPLTPKATPLKRPSSEVISFSFSPRLHKSTTVKEITPESEARDTRPFEIREPQKIYQQFAKNTLTDFFDISQCHLPSDKVVDYVHRAKRIHRIKGLKLCNNRLTAVGFQKMTDFLQGVSNINLANNNINEQIFEAIYHNRDKLESLKMLNLSHNPITLDKKASSRMEDIKKCGIIIIL